MTQVSITAVARDDFGKGAARRLRRAGLVPAVIYGGDVELQHVSLPAHELDLALRKPKVVLEVDLGSTKQLVKPRDVQREPVRRYLEHVDLVVVSQAEAAARSASADAIVLAEAAAVEGGVDKVAVAIVVQQLIAEGMGVNEAIEQAVADARGKVRDAAAAAAASDAAAAEGGEGAASGGSAPAEEAAAESADE